MNPYDILQRALKAIKKLEADPRVLHAEIVGSMRRGRPNVGDLDLLLVTNDPWSFYEGPRRFTGLPRDRHRIADVFVATPLNYGATLVFGTGPRLLNTKLRQRAAERNLVFDFRGKLEQVSAQFSPFIGLHKPNGELVPTPTEEAFFRLLDVPYVPPTYRDWLAERI